MKGFYYEYPTREGLIIQYCPCSLWLPLDIKWRSNNLRAYTGFVAYSLFLLIVVFPNSISGDLYCVLGWCSGEQDLHLCEYLKYPLQLFQFVVLNWLAHVPQDSTSTGIALSKRTCSMIFHHLQFTCQYFKMLEHHIANCGRIYVHSFKYQEVIRPADATNLRRRSAA